MPCHSTTMMKENTWFSETHRIDEKFTAVRGGCTLGFKTKATPKSSEYIDLRVKLWTHGVYTRGPDPRYGKMKWRYVSSLSHQISWSAWKTSLLLVCESNLESDSRVHWRWIGPQVSWTRTLMWTCPKIQATQSLSEWVQDNTNLPI